MSADDAVAFNRYANSRIDPRLAGVRPSALMGDRLLELERELRGPAMEWLRQSPPTVLGFGYGVQWAAGQPTSNPVFIVFASRALDLARVGPAGVFPEAYRDLVALAVTREQHAVGGAAATAPAAQTWDLDAHEPAAALAFLGVEPDALQRRARPMRGGCSAAHPSVSAGTLGMRVTPNRAERGAVDDGAALLLSNCHVLAADPSHPVEGDPILQPSAGDAGDPSRDVVGRVLRAMPLHAGLDYPNRMDAAIARIDDARWLAPGIGPLGEIPLWRASSDLSIGTRVAKVGRSSGLTFGVVKALGVTYKVRYRLGAAGPCDVLFSGQIMTSHMAVGGDSGSMLLALGAAPDAPPAVAGLVLGGSADVTLASPIEGIHAHFDVLTAPARWSRWG